MRANSPSAYFSSALLHVSVIVLIWLLSYAAQHQVRETPAVFEMVAGPGDNFAATEAPGESGPSGVKLAVPAPVPEPPRAAEPPATPVESVPPPPSKPADPAPNFTKTVKRIADKREKNIEKKFHDEQEKQARLEAAKMKAMSKADYDKQNKDRKNPTPATGAPKVARINTDEIVKGVSGGTGTAPGAGGTALTREQGEVIDAYYSMLKQRLKVAFEQPPGLSDTLVAYVKVRSGADGSLSGAQITKSSGSAEFDQAVLAAVSRTRMPERPDHKSEVVTFPFTMREKDEG